jgi:hypothetical protein
MTQPMSRDAMRELKAKTEEAARIQQLKNIVQQIYQAAIQTAKSKTDTSYNHPLPLTRAVSETVVLGSQKFGCNSNMITDPFYLKNMPDILAGLQELFPGCDVTHTLLSRGTDGKMYDISKLDEKVLPFVNRALDQSYIVVDWS